MNADEDRSAHWEGVYRAKAPTDVSWFQARPQVSLDLIGRTGMAKDARIVDVGAGASTLVDHLLAEGRSSLTLLDLSESALAHTRARLGADAERVTWVVGDVRTWRPEIKVDLWHDRAVLHFLTSRSDQEAYSYTVSAALKPNGWAVIAGFAPGGPAKCSGLDIVQHDEASLQSLLGGAFDLITTRDEVHNTPWGAAQAFRYHLFHRRSG
jgi:SAM-dependent methyltransferase